MIPKIDLGFSATSERFNEWLENSREYLDNNLNETETRSKIIDPLFKDVFGWDEIQIKREEHINKIGYFDYEFICGGNKFILEAKKEFVKFEMPTSTVVKSSSLGSKFSGLKGAITQGIDYAVPRKIDVVVVFNGTHVAVTYVPYTHLSGNDTYLFQGHDKIHNDFINFYNLLSPITNLTEKLIGLINSTQNQLIRPRPPFVDRISRKQGNPDDVLPSNSLANLLGSIHDKYFTEIISDWDLLKKCYCDYDSAHQYEKSIEFVLRDRAPRLGKVVEEIELTEEDNTKPISELRTTKRSADVFDSRYLESRSRSKMFLLIGGAGVGKTTFIHRFFNFMLSPEDRESTVWIYIDCKECAHDTNLDHFIYQKIEDEILEKYDRLGIFDDPSTLKQVFTNELKKRKALLAFLPEDQLNAEIFKVINNIMENTKDIYIKRVFEYIQKIGMSTCIVYDNVDQLDSRLQQKLFLHGNAIKERLRTTLILSLREEVYYEHENDKSFNFSDCDVFHIPAPKIFNVLAKRLKAAKEDYSESDVLFVNNSSGTSIGLKYLDVIDVLTQTFLGNQENTLLLETISNRDVRESLKLFKRVISSANVNYDPLLIAAGVSSTVKVPSDRRIEHHNLLRGLALDNRVHYSSTSSKILNIFAISNDGFFSHMTKLRILKFAEANLGLAVGNLPKGFFKLSDMYNEFFKYTVRDILSFKDICLNLQKEGLLINLHGTISVINDNDFITLGPSGYYYLNHLKHDVHYLALVAIDATISNDDSAKRIEELYRKSLNATDFQKNKRYHEIATTFVDYLIGSEQEELEALSKLGCPDLENPFYRIASSIQAEIK
ncbi:hypothetical protein [Paenibacillus sp. P13VS]|uniref:hypothetical protein n=1 Tax=Paenibacillus sp. P13VS TaxID=2697367 RepID=UPI00187BC279|nr:hypothetical protein [Paenibacillus sp. P13VS]MBE7683256.1 hypothetical protein [Paenibacillus sp. P13VS]